MGLGDQTRVLKLALVSPSQALESESIPRGGETLLQGKHLRVGYRLREGLLALVTWQAS